MGGKRKFDSPLTPCVPGLMSVNGCNARWNEVVPGCPQRATCFYLKRSKPFWERSDNEVLMLSLLNPYFQQMWKSGGIADCFQSPLIRNSWFSSDQPGPLAWTPHSGWLVSCVMLICFIDFRYLCMLPSRTFFFLVAWSKTQHIQALGRRRLFDYVTEQVRVRCRPGRTQPSSLVFTFLPSASSGVNPIPHAAPCPTVGSSKGSRKGLSLHV